MRNTPKRFALIQKSETRTFDTFDDAEAARRPGENALVRDSATDRSVFIVARIDATRGASA